MGNVVHAQVTVTFGRWKPGLLMGGGPHHSGKVVVADLGQGAVAKEADETASLLEGVDIAGEWPNRLSGDHKNRSGHLLLIAGSESMAGAAVLAARGALAAGVGLLTLSTPRSALPRLAGLPSEAMWIALEELDASVWREKTAWAIGPGLSALSEAQRALLLERWVEAEIPAVGDAAWLDERLPKARLPRVITPHPGEAARILNVSKEEIQADRLAAATALAAHGVALLKGPFTVVASPDGKRTFNSTNSQVLGTGGSGDVLTGVIGALLARGVSPDRAARMAAWVHGRAGELLEAERSQGWTASDIAERIPAAIEDLVRTSSKFP